MVHRPSDARLLANLLSHEKDYLKHLESLLDSSHASLASFSAFSVASSPRLSQTILSIAGYFSSADDALRHYKDAVDAWREQLKTLKDFEAEIANIARDRDILVTRLLKASKNEKPPKDKDRKSTPSRRSSFVSQSQRLASSSSLSLSADHSMSTPTASVSLPTSTKLAVAQAELQACEVQLSTKERDLETARVTAIRDGLRIRCNALIQCGRAWVVAGRDASNVLEGLQLHGESYIAPHSPVSVPQKVHLLRTGNGNNSLGHHHFSSDLSSISPSQSASQVNMDIIEPSVDNPAIIPNAPNPILGVNGSDIQDEQPGATTNVTPPLHVSRSGEVVERPRSTPPETSLPHRTNSLYGALRRQASRSMNNITSVERNSGYEYNQIQIPPAHAITDAAVPMPTILQSDSRHEAARQGSGYWTPVSNEGEQARTQQLATEGGGLQHIVVETPRSQKLAPPIALPIEASAVEVTRAVTTTGGVPRSEDVGVNISGVTEVRRDEEPLVRHFVENLPDSPPEPQTPKKSSKRSGPATPQRTGLLGSLKKVFGRSDAAEREEKTREKQEKARMREEKAREKEEKKEGKAREREEKREGRVREKEGKTRDKQKQKKEREKKRRMKVLMPDSSDDSAASDDDDSIRRHHSGLASGFMGLRKKDEKWTTRTEKNLDELRRANREADVAEGLVGGFVVRKNTDLERNLRGGLVGGHAAPLDLRGGQEGSVGAAGSTVSLNMDNGVRGKKLRKGGRTEHTDGGFVFERGMRTTRSLSVSEGQSSGGANAPSLLFPPPPIPPAVASVSPGGKARFKEDFTFSSIPVTSTPNKREAVRDKGARDTPAFASPTRSSGFLATPANIPDAHSLSVPAIERRSSEKKKGASVTQTDISSDPHLGRNTSVLTNATPALGTGLASRRKSVDVPTVSTRPTGRGSHRRTASVDYGRAGLPGVSPRTSQFTPGAGRPRESLMSIVDNVTRTNRHAWDTGLMESKVDRTKGVMRSEVGGTFLGPVVPGTGVRTAVNGDSAAVGSGVGRVVGMNGAMMNGAPTGAQDRKGTTEVARAPPRVDREALLLSLRGTTGSPGGHQSVTTAYTMTGAGADGTMGKKPLKSALRNSRTPSPSGVLQRSTVDRSSIGRHGYGYMTGKGELAPLEALPSLSSLPLEEQAMPPPVGPVETVNGVNRYAGKRDDDDDATSVSSYETGHEDFESTDEDWRNDFRPTTTLTPTPAPRQKGDAGQKRESLQLVMPSPVRPAPPPSDLTPDHASHSFEPTPQRRKSVRVSLKPTFSPTPPAIEDEEDQTGRAPFVFQESTQVLPLTKRVSTEYRTPEIKGKNIWDDDSDDNVEYRVARQRLQRATREQAELR